MGLAAFYLVVYIPGWLIYINRLRQHPGQNNAIIVNQDGSVALRRHGFIWQKIRSTYRFNMEYYHNTSLWDTNGNLCPIGARFFWGIAVFPFINVIVDTFSLAVKPLQTTFQPIWQGIPDEEVFEAWLSGIKNAPSVKDGVSFWQHCKKIGSAILDVTWTLEVIASPFVAFALLIAAIFWVAKGVLKILWRLLSLQVPTGPTLFPGWSFWDNEEPSPIWEYLGLGVALSILFSFASYLLMSILTPIILWTLYGVGWVNEGDAASTALAVLFLAIGAVLLLAAFLDSRDTPAPKESNPVFVFISAWLRAKHGQLCPPVEFLDPEEDGAETASA